MALCTALHDNGFVVAHTRMESLGIGGVRLCVLPKPLIGCHIKSEDLASTDPYWDQQWSAENRAPIPFGDLHPCSTNGMVFASKSSSYRRMKANSSRGQLT